jgi:hypothetical protein
MRSHRFTLVFAAVAALLLLSLADCTTIMLPVPGPASGGRKGSPAKVAPPARHDLPFPAISNHSTVKLEAGNYIGDLTIKANKVTIIGRGVGATRIRGNLTIIGNNCTMTQLTISGFVRIDGNNADLRGAQVEGKVQSTGKDNVW